MSTADIIGDKRVNAFTTGKNPLIHRQDNHILEIQAASLEQAHYLQSLYGLTSKRHDCRSREPVNQIEH